MIKNKSVIRGHFLLTVLIIIILVLAIGPWLDGFIFKRNYLTFLNNLNQDAANMNIKVINYQMGWLKSSAKLSINFNNTFTGKPITVNVDQTILHGPFIYDRSHSTLKFAEAIIQSKFSYDQLQNVPLTLPVLSVETTANFTNGFNNHFEIAPYHAEIPMVAKLDWQGLDAYLFLQSQSHYISRIQNDAHFRTLTLSGANSSLQLEGIVVKNQYSHKQDSLWQGEDHLTIPTLTISRGNQTYQLTQYKIDSHYGNNAQNGYDIQSIISLEQLVLPLMTITPSKSTITLQNLNSNTLKQIMNLTKTFQGKTNNAFLTQYNQLLLQLITPNTSLSLDNVLTTSEGNMTTATKLTWAANTPLPTTAPEILKGLNGQLNARVSKQLVAFIIEQIETAKKSRMDYENHAAPSTVTPSLTNAASETPPAPSPITPTPVTPNTVAPIATPVSPTLTDQLNQLIQQGYISEDGNDYVITMTYQNGTLMINQKQVPLPF